MTNRLYYGDGYRTEFVARVLRNEPGEDGRRRVVLDASCFYPTSGGQLFDHGELGGHPILDILDEGTEVIHIVDAGFALDPGSEVAGRVDAERRRHHREQHSGQHVLSRIIEDRLGLPTVSSRLGESGNTLDLEVEAIDPDALDAIEDEAARIIAEGRRVDIHFLEPDEAAVAALDKIPSRDGPLRVIEVEGLDRNACGGTHVRNTAEIGDIVITRSEKVKGGVRLHFLCGDRARSYRRRRDRLVSRLCAMLTTGDDTLERSVERLQEEARAASKRSLGLARQLAAARAREWLEEAEELDLDGARVRAVCRALPSDLSPALGEAVARLIEIDDVVALLVAPGEERSQVVAARGKGAGVDCGALLRTALQAIGGKGGGKPERAQGGFSGDVDVAMAAFRSALGLKR